MRRREILYALCGAAALWPLAARTQQRERLYRIGILSLLPRPTEQLFRDAMRDLGYQEGKNVIYEVRYAAGDFDRLRALAVELVRLKVDVIVTAGWPAADAAKRATTAVPIVLWGAGDPIGSGIIADVRHPGGNITGVTELSTELTGKRLQLFKETLPELKSVAVLWNAGDRAMSLRFREAEAAAPGLGIRIIAFPIRIIDDFESAFDAMARDRPDGIFVVTDQLTRLKEGALFEFARAQRLPTMFEFPPSARDGGLMSYGPNLSDLVPRAAAFVDKILKGAKPGDLPLEMPVRWYLIINLKTAKRLGLSIPPSILVQADELIE